MISEAGGWEKAEWGWSGTGAKRLGMGMLSLELMSSCSVQQKKYRLIEDYAFEDYMSKTMHVEDYARTSIV